jgi:hypothetical protein
VQFEKIEPVRPCLYSGSSMQGTAAHKRTLDLILLPVLVDILQD